MLRVFGSDAGPEQPAMKRFVLHDAVRDQPRELIAHSEALLGVIDMAERVARSKVPVLILGESGTGKELLARLIHEHSPRADKNFVQINCAAFSETLIESELFGHEKGAFTGAELRHIGYFERANGGSLLLDEIGEMPLKLQAKLLRVLEEEAFERVGGEQLVKVDVRVIATTNRELEHEIERGTFRRDLFYRLSTVQLPLPPLRARPDEIPALVRHFIESFGTEGQVQVTTIAARALEMLVSYSWPGNVRQLRNVIHHACVLARGCCLETSDLPPLREPGAERFPVSKNQTLADLERQRILETLREVGGNRSAAALRLGVTTRTLQNKLKKYRAEEGIQEDAA